MKKILFLITLFVVALGANASDFTTNNKKGSDDRVFTVDQWKTNYSLGKIATLTQAQAQEAAALFEKPLLYVAGGKVYRINGTLAAEATPQVDDWFVAAFSDDAYFPEFFDLIVNAENEIPNLALDKHQGWGSKIAEAANLASSIKSEVGDIENNGPQTGLQKSIEAAIKSFQKRDSEIDVFEKDPKTRLSDDFDGFKGMFDYLETVRDSLGLFYQFAHSKDVSFVDAENNDVTLNLPREVINYPGAEKMFGDIWDNALETYKTSEDYETVAAIGSMLLGTVQNLGQNTQLYNEETLNFYDAALNGSVQIVESSGRYPLVNRKWATPDGYAFCVLVPTLQMINAAKTFASDQAKWTATAPTPASALSKAIDVAILVANEALAANLMAKDIMLLMKCNEVADWIDSECDDDYSYVDLIEQLYRSVDKMQVAQSAASVQSEHDILDMKWQRAKDLKALGNIQPELSDLIFKVTDTFNAMKDFRADDETLFQSKQNLRYYLNLASEALRTINTTKAMTYSHPAEGEYDLFDLNWYTADHVYGYQTPADQIDREIDRLQNAWDLFAKQYELEQKIDEVIAYKDSVHVTAQGKDVIAANPQKVLNDAFTTATIFNADVTNLQKLVADINVEIGVLDDAMAEAKEHQEKIQEEIDITEDIIANLDNNGPLDDLLAALDEAVGKFQTQDDYNTVVNEIIEDLIDKREWDRDTFDEPLYYIDYMIENAETWYANNLMYLTAEQLAAYEQAMAAAQIARAEWLDDRYQDPDQLEREYKKFRMWCASLALEYVEKMTIDTTEGVDPEIADKQLEEAMILVAIAAASGQFNTIDDAKAALKAGNSIYRDEESTSEEKAAAAKRLLALLNNTTGISNVNSNAQLRDGKYMENGKLVIVKGGKKFNAVGIAR